MLDSALQQQLSAYLTKLRHPVELLASLDDRPASTEMRALLSDITHASGQVSMREVRLSRSPAFGVSAAGEPARVVFAGLPLGYEFTSLVLALLWAGGHPPKVEPAVLEQIRALEGDFEFEVYMSLTCHNCPDVVQALSLMAILNRYIEPRKT